MKSRHTALKTAVVGIGGFAASHHAALWELEEEGFVKVIATCDPQATELGERQLQYQFEERGIAVYRDFDSLLRIHGESLDLVTVVSPIRYHAEHHRACVERGIACYLEKPPTLDPEELEIMISVETGARNSTQVGFNQISEIWRQELKKRILAGEFGRLRRVAFQGLARRSLAYYGRNGWAGRLILDDFILLDSCCGNAMAHQVHNLLFYAGEESLLSWSEPSTVEAELYRANAIEGPDTIFARGTLKNGVEFLLAATHACEPNLIQKEIIECDDAVIEILAPGQVAIFRRHGPVETIDTPSITLKENLKNYWEYLAGQHPRPVTLLQDCRPFVHLNALLYLGAGRIHTLSAEHIEARRLADENEETVYVSGIQEVCEKFLSTGKFPSESGVPWGCQGGKAELSEMGLLRQRVRQLSQNRRNA